MKNYFLGTEEDEDADPVGPFRDLRTLFAELATEARLIRPGDPIDQNLVDFAIAVVGLCADIADKYGDEDAGGNAGAHIRAELWPQ